MSRIEEALREYLAAEEEGQKQGEIAVKCYEFDKRLAILVREAYVKGWQDGRRANVAHS